MNRQRPVALVTGGRRGIGLGIARALAAKGFDLAIPDIANDESVIHELRDMGGKGAFFKSDLAAVETHEATIAAVLNEFGGIDCLVNNAGMGSVERGDFLRLKPENFDTIMDVNLRGTVFFTQAVVKAMLTANEVRFPRSIITISSVSSVMTSPERLDMTAKVAERYDTLIDGGLVPMKRWGEAGDVGAIVTGLAGGDFIFATGSAINADGGLSIAKL